MDFLMNQQFWMSIAESLTTIAVGVTSIAFIIKSASSSKSLNDSTARAVVKMSNETYNVKKDVVEYKKIIARQDMIIAKQDKMIKKLVDHIDTGDKQ